jgi:hypothetical protein
LLDEGILNGTGIGVQESRSLSTEVLKNFQTVVRNLAQVRLTYGSAYGFLLELLQLTGRVSRG